MSDKSSEKYEVESIKDNQNVLRRYNCSKCGAFPTYNVCVNDPIILEEGYHRGFLGLLETDCYAYYYGCRGVNMCLDCGHVLFTYDRHYCYEDHKKCSKKIYNVCPMDLKNDRMRIDELTDK